MLLNERLPVGVVKRDDVPKQTVAAVNVHQAAGPIWEVQGLRGGPVVFLLVVRDPVLVRDLPVQGLLDRVLAVRVGSYLATGS